MLEVDLHVHSLFSSCGLHTILELLAHGRSIGLKAIAITDHGPAVEEGRLTSVFFERFKSPYPDIRLYKGIELNLIDENGAIDMVWPLMPLVDILLLGAHPNLEKGRPKAWYTDMFLAAIEKNPFIDILTHPNDPTYPLDFRRLAESAKRHGMAIELNNSKILYRRGTSQGALELINACKEAGCLMVVNSDTHALQELGGDESVRPLLEEVGFPESFIINRDPAAAAAFIEGRRKFKKKRMNDEG